MILTSDTKFYINIIPNLKGLKTSIHIIRSRDCSGTKLTHTRDKKSKNESIRMFKDLPCIILELYITNEKSLVTPCKERQQ